ncbi:MAG TPA: TlpA disulfide reductase family protein [Candidatus Binataceae bacterium]|nr:TlpA disulfide reductase family protein [Candidatus Binataceae bacterium]
MRPAVRLAALAAAILAIAGLSEIARAAAHVGEPAPALVVPELDGHPFDLAAQRGKVVIVNFWATWCRPCREEMPALDAFYRRYHGQGLELIGLSADRPHDRSDVGKMMQSFSYPAAMLDDAKVNDFDTPAVLPVTFVVDRDGVVRARLTPDETPVTEKSLADAVLPLLREKAGSPASPSPDSTASP